MAATREGGAGLQLDEQDADALAVLGVAAGLDVAGAVRLAEAELGERPDGVEGQVAEVALRGLVQPPGPVRPPDEVVEHARHVHVPLEGDEAQLARRQQQHPAAAGAGAARRRGARRRRRRRWRLPGLRYLRAWAARRCCRCRRIVGVGVSPEGWSLIAETFEPRLYAALTCRLSLVWRLVSRCAY